MEFKKIIDYVEENKKEYLQRILEENKLKLEAQKYLNGLTREELKHVLSSAGFEVEDGEGKVIFTREENITDEKS